MFDYLQQFNKLPKELKEKVSSPRAMEILASLEKKYGINLAMITMQIMVKQILFKDLPKYLSSEMGLEPLQARALTDELKEKLFFSLITYLGLRAPALMTPEEKDLEILMKENNIILASQELLTRSRNILLTYKKGVRSKIDARAALERPVDQGGIGLDQNMAERLLNLLQPKDQTAEAKEISMTQDQAKDFSNISNLVSVEAQAEIDQLINRNDAASAYNLKENLEQGNLKIPSQLVDKFKVQEKPLDPSHELEAPDKILGLKAPADKLQIEANSHTPKSDEVVSLEAVPKSVDLEPELARVSDIKTTLDPEKIEQVDKLKPEEIDDRNSFKKSSPKKEKTSNGLFSKLFKSKKSKNRVDKSPLANMKSSHLEAMVKAAALESQMKSRPAASSSSRLKMHDVKVRPKVMGPLEELRYLDLTNFRRLGDDPEQITSKIISKIKILKKDGYDKMILGVQAWRQSPVNRSYVKLLQDAVINGITVDELLELRDERKQIGLSKSEIIAIVEMNNKLLF